MIDYFSAFQKHRLQLTDISTDTREAFHKSHKDIEKQLSMRNE